MTSGASVHCFALRRLNPMRGVVEMVETQAGRASSLNGRTWEGAEVVENVLREHAHTVPFKLIDHQELWLLDQDRQPMALLASARPGEPLSTAKGH